MGFTKQSQINWGIIGVGNVCEVKSAPAMNLINNSRLVAVMRRDGAKAEAYAKKHGVPRWYDQADDLINDPEMGEKIDEAALAADHGLRGSVEDGADLVVDLDEVQDAVDRDLRKDDDDVPGTRFTQAVQRLPGDDDRPERGSGKFFFQGPGCHPSQDIRDSSYLPLSMQLVFLPGIAVDAPYEVAAMRGDSLTTDAIIDRNPDPLDPPPRFGAA